MNKENIYSAIEKKVNEDYFTGRVTLREIFSEQVHSEQEMYHVTFHNGARTTLHYHESDQILVATSGKGVVGLIKGTKVSDFEIDEKDIIFFEEEGDTVCIPANRLHFHGAISGSSGKGDFSHLAIRKMYLNNITQAVKKAKNEWECDLIAKEIGNKDPVIIKQIARNISEKIQTAILKRLELEKNKPTGPS
jgi:quercetin dioxygenase-like cupin family protein